MLIGGSGRVRAGFVRRYTEVPGKNSSISAVPALSVVQRRSRSGVLAAQLSRIPIMRKHSRAMERGFRVFMMVCLPGFCVVQRDEYPFLRCEGSGYYLK